jgi:antitoxin component YwqK of YwqJK toxin-antitoxin module
MKTSILISLTFVVILLGCDYPKKWVYERKLPESATDIKLYTWFSKKSPGYVHYLKAKMSEGAYKGYIRSLNLSIHTSSRYYNDDIEWLSTYGVHHDSVASWWDEKSKEKIYVSQEKTEWIQARYSNGYLYLYAIRHENEHEPIKPLSTHNANPFLHDEKETFIARYKSIASKEYPNFNFSNSHLDVIHDDIDSSKIITIRALNSSGKANGPFIGFYKNKAIKLVTFFENDTILGWTNWYDSFGNLEEKQLPFPPPLGNEGKMIYYEKFGTNEEVINCWSVRFTPEEKQIEIDTNNFSKSISICCDSCISYLAKTQTIHLNDTIKKEFNFINSDTIFLFKNLKIGQNKIIIEIKAKQPNGSSKIGWHNFNIKRKN